MNQISASVQKSATDPNAVRATNAHAAHGADQGGAVVAKAIAAMDEIECSAREISQISGVIDGIAFQTNLLALNAGVEAARRNHRRCQSVERRSGTAHRARAPVPHPRR